MDTDPHGSSSSFLWKELKMNRSHVVRRILALGLAVSLGAASAPAEVCRVPWVHSLFLVPCLRDSPAIGADLTLPRNTADAKQKPCATPVRAGRLRG